MIINIKIIEFKTESKFTKNDEQETYKINDRDDKEYRKKSLSNLLTYHITKCT
jgi:hypothetical protein